MMAHRFWMTLGIGGLLLGWMSAPARAQAVYTGQTAAQNLAISMSDDHRPGGMVVSGLARAKSAVRNPAAPFEITDDGQFGIAQELRIEAINTVLIDAMDFFAALVVRYLLREGLILSLPDDSGSAGNGDGNGDDGSSRDDSTSDGGKGDVRKSTLFPRTVLPRPTD